MCGDTACPSCGPAQGYDPEAEALLETIYERLGKIFRVIGESEDHDLARDTLKLVLGWVEEPLAEHLAALVDALVEKERQRADRAEAEWERSEQKLVDALLEVEEGRQERAEMRAEMRAEEPRW